MAILLCRQDELSYEEIAKVMGCSVSATKSLIHRGAGNVEAEAQALPADRGLARTHGNATLLTLRF